MTNPETSLMTTATHTRPAPSSRTTVDHAAFQRAQVAVYQRELADAGGNPRQVGRAGAQALADVLADIDRLLRKVVRDELARRFPGYPPADLFEECLAEARLACVEAARDYDGSKKSFSSWVTDPHVGGRALAAIRTTIQGETRHGELTKGQETVTRYARGAIADFRARGVEPSAEQVTAEVYDRCHTWARERVHEQWAREGRSMPGAHDSAGWARVDAEAAHLAAAKLTKDGTLAAVRSLWDFLPQSDQTGVLDVALLDTDVQTIGGVAPDGVADERSDVARVAVCGLDAADQALVWAHLFDEVDNPTRKVGQDGQTPAGQRAGRARVAALLTGARTRLSAPHAHFAALCPSLSLQFDVREPAEPAHSRAVLTRAVLAAHLDT